MTARGTGRGFTVIVVATSNGGGNGGRDCRNCSAGEVRPVSPSRTESIRTLKTGGGLAGFDNPDPERRPNRICGRLQSMNQLLELAGRSSILFVSTLPRSRANYVDREWQTSCFSRAPRQVGRRNEDSKFRSVPEAQSLVCRLKLAGGAHFILRTYLKHSESRLTKIILSRGGGRSMRRRMVSS
jgi:hypothetical protein